MSDFWLLAPGAVTTLIITIPGSAFLFRFINFKRNYTMSDRKEALVIGLVLSVVLAFLVTFLVVALVWSNLSKPVEILDLVQFAFDVALATMLLVVPPVWLFMLAISFLPFFFAESDGGRN